MDTTELEPIEGRGADIGPRSLLLQTTYGHPVNNVHRVWMPITEEAFADLEDDPDFRAIVMARLRAQRDATVPRSYGGAEQWSYGGHVPAEDAYHEFLERERVLDWGS